MIAAALAMAAPGAVHSVARMRHERRVLVVAAPSPTDAKLRAQQNALAGWRRGAADRDVSVVTVVGDRVTGAADPAAGLRAAHRLPSGAFAVVLIGKDGHEAYRSADPVTAEALQGTIDAMPMRRAGQR